MKPENDPGVTIQSPPRKSYNPFDSDDEDTNAFVSDVNAYDIRSLENYADPLTFHLGTGDSSWEEAIFSHSPVTTYKILDNANGGEPMSRKATLFFTKTTMEYERPVLKVCEKGSAYHSVKDIGIDDGVPSHDKLWTKSQEIYKTEKHHGLPLQQALNPGSENGLEKDVSIEGSTEVSPKDHPLDSEDLAKQHSAIPCGINAPIKMYEYEHDLSKHGPNSSWRIAGDKTMVSIRTYDTKFRGMSKTVGKSYIKAELEGNKVSKENGNDNVPLKQDIESSPKPSVMNGIEAFAESSKNQTGEAISPQSCVLSALQESASNGIVNALSYNRKMDPGSLFSDNLQGKEKEEKENKTTQWQNEAVLMSPETQTLIVEKAPETQTMARLDEGGPVSITVSGIDKWHGEMSSFADMTLPVSVNLVGSNTRSGSISLRSESSAGSTRSFAFPVMQAESNGSPARMAKADANQRRRGWFHLLFCCKS